VRPSWRWAVELLGLYLLGAVALFLREQVNLQFLQVILGIKYSFRNLKCPLTTIKGHFNYITVY
jgi:hypothetical protein